MAIELKVNSKNVDAIIDLPASKSINNRVLIINALTNFNCEIKNSSTAQDTVTLTYILKEFKEGKSSFDVGHAGTTMRFLTAYFCMQKGEQVLTGSSRMKERPIKVLVDSLRSIGAEIDYLENDGFPPLKIRSTSINKDELSIDGGVSSQYISALMLIAPYLEKGLSIKLTKEIVSRPYIEMTKNIMKYFGAEVFFDDNVISISSKEYEPKLFFVEGDWSGSSYWYSVAALSDKTEIKINSLRSKSEQGDNVIAQIYKKLGVDTAYLEDSIVLKKNTEFEMLENEFEFDFSNCPDLAQTVVVTCLGLNLPCFFTGLKTLKIKETDRLLALKKECEKLGGRVEITNETLRLIPGELKVSAIDTYDDHRMAMAFAPLSLKIDGLIINDEHVVKKSYPTFWSDFSKV